MEVWFIYVRLSCSSWSSYREKRKLPKYIRQKFLAGFVLNICCRLFSQNQLLWFEILLLERKVLVRTHSFSTFLSLFEFIFRRLELLTSDSSFFMNNGQVQWGSNDWLGFRSSVLSANDQDKKRCQLFPSETLLNSGGREVTRCQSEMRDAQSPGTLTEECVQCVTSWQTNRKASK